jgi:hypothetical protein
MVQDRRLAQEAMMTVQDRIADYLFLAGGKSYCNDCLSSALAIPSDQIEKEVSALAEEGWIKSSDGTCTSCGLSKLVSKRRIGSFAA